MCTASAGVGNTDRQRKADRNALERMLLAPHERPNLSQQKRVVESSSPGRRWCLLWWYRQL